MCIRDRILIVPRIYTNKPRTDGAGYKGMLHQPDPDKKPDMLDVYKRQVIALCAPVKQTPSPI